MAIESYTCINYVCMWTICNNKFKCYNCFDWNNNDSLCSYRYNRKYNFYEKC